MSEHHPLSPSHYNAWQHCIHWKGADKQSDEASAGTKAHAELEYGLKDREYEPDSYVARWARDTIIAECGDIEPQSEVRLEGTLQGFVGIFGTADVLWQGSEGFLHIADLKTFSDGTEDYSAQLKGYAALWAKRDTPFDLKVFLHVLHGGICKMETFEFEIGDCIFDTDEIIREVSDKKDEPSICKYCQWCEHIKECKAVNNAVATVNDNSVQFGKMSLPQKLVVCETIEKLIKSLKEDAKAQAIANGGVLEADGIRYEIKEKFGASKVRDILEVATAMVEPQSFNKKGEPTKINGLTDDELLKLCSLPKTAFVAAMKEKNKDITSVPKKNIEQFCAAFYDKGEQVQSLVRVK